MRDSLTGRGEIICKSCGELQITLQLASQTFGQGSPDQGLEDEVFIIEVVPHDHVLTYWKDGDKMDAPLQKVVTGAQFIYISLYLFL